MASTRKSRMINKRFSKLSEEPPDKDGSNTDKTWTKKRKLSDMLGSQWSKEELERFYVAYRKYGKDWKKVAGIIRGRTIDMVEALYNMNRAYLSLPEGTATTAGLIAMMTDHYNILDGSDSENDSNGGIKPSEKLQKQVHGRFRSNVSKGSEASHLDLLQYKLSTTSFCCLSLLKKKRSGGIRPRAVGKRTPRFPVSYADVREDRHEFVSPDKQVKSDGDDDDDDDDGVHVAALALAEASQRGGSPQVSRTPGRAQHAKSSPVESSKIKHVELKATNSKFIAARKNDGGPEGSLGSVEAETGGLDLGNSYLDSENANTVGTRKKVRKSIGTELKAVRIENCLVDEDISEACGGTEEGVSVGSTKAEVGTVVSDRKTSRSYQGSRKRNRQLFSGDENAALDALQTLAALSFNILLPGAAVEPGSSVQAKEDEKNADSENPSVPETSTKSKKDKSKVLPRKAGMVVGTRKSSKQQKASSSVAHVPPKEKQQTHQPASRVGEKKQKLTISEGPKDEVVEDTRRNKSQKKETMVEEPKKSTSKANRVNQVSSQKLTKLVKTLEQASIGPDMSRTTMNEPESAPQISTAKQGILPSKPKNRRKMGLQKALARRELKPFVLAGEDHSHKYVNTDSGRVADSKKKLSHCLSSPLLRRWCVFEWFYSAIDYPWFVRSEFVEYLNHVGLGHVPRLTRVEWGVIRSSLGKPRRLSKQFLQEEREKLEQYRESVRTHYSELRAGIREGLPTDLARPLSVGQRVIACHPKTREIHDGSILTVDRNRCRVQFDCPELGVGFVKDIDCMALNPSENMPDALRRRNLMVDEISEAVGETKPYSQLQDWSLGESNGEHADGSCNVPSSNYPINTLMEQAKGDTIDAIVEAKAAANEVAAAAQQKMYTHPYTLAQIQAREADIKALAELTRALDKKEALLIELRNMNEEVSTKQKGDSIKEFEHFRKQYAMVLLQLRDANDQVASALLYLRQRNTYHGNATPPWVKSMDNSGVPPVAQGTQDSGTHVLEIVEDSRRKARAMVDVAEKALSSLKEGEDAFEKIGEALDSVKTWHSVGDSALSSVKSIPPSEPGQTSPALHDQAAACIFEPTTNQAPSLKPNTISNGTEFQHPSQLMSSCVATLLLIQTCTERHDPPAEIAQILDFAVSSLQPRCPQNLAIYREIELCMGIIKNQILAKIPIPSTVPPSDIDIV